MIKDCDLECRRVFGLRCYPELASRPPEAAVPAAVSAAAAAVGVSAAAAVWWSARGRGWRGGTAPAPPAPAGSSPPPRAQHLLSPLLSSVPPVSVQPGQLVSWKYLYLMHNIWLTKAADARRHIATVERVAGYWPRPNYSKVIYDLCCRGREATRKPELTLSVLSSDAASMIITLGPSIHWARYKQFKTQYTHRTETFQQFVNHWRIFRTFLHMNIWNPIHTESIQ